MVGAEQLTINPTTTLHSQTRTSTSEKIKDGDSAKDHAIPVQMLLWEG